MRPSGCAQTRLNCVIWIASVVLLGLVVVLAQLLLVYQKRAHDLRMKMEPIRRRIRNHRSTMAEVFSKVQERGAESLASVDRFLDTQGDKLERAETVYEDLSGEDMLQTPEENDDSDAPDPLDDEDYDPEFEAQASAARETAREVIAGHESIESQLNEMGRDRDVIARTLERMQSQFGEEAGGGKPRRRKSKATK